MRHIAEDETRHAELSWQIAEWAAERLDSAATGRIEAAMQHAVDDLAREVAVEPSHAVVHVAGVPSARAARRMIDELRAKLWRPALAA